MDDTNTCITFFVGGQEWGFMWYATVSVKLLSFPCKVIAQGIEKELQGCPWMCAYVEIIFKIVQMF